MIHNSYIGSPAQKHQQWQYFWEEYNESYSIVPVTWLFLLEVGATLT